MTRKSNDTHMKGKQRAVGPRGPAMYPWAEMAVGDWFIGKCCAKVTACTRNQRGPEVYKSVTKEKQNIVVRVK